MEAQMVQTPLAGRLDGLHPAALIGGRRAGQGEDAALQRAAQEDGLTIDEQTAAVGADLAHAEGHLADVAADVGAQPVERRLQLAPQAGLGNV